MAQELYTTPLFNNASLKAYYRMEGNSNDSKSTHNGSDTAISYGTAYGKFNQGASFDGATSFISITDHSDFKPTTGPYTFGLWFNRQDTSTGDVFQTYGDPGGTASGIELLMSANPTLNHASLGNVNGLSATGSPFGTGVLNNVVVTWDGTTAFIYANGTLNNSGTLLVPSYNATNYVEIGRRNNGPTQTNYFKGYIDDHFFFNGYQWSSEDVRNYYTGFSSILPDIL